MIDLHIHTNFSDGTYTPKEIILLAKEKGLKAISITDHDTLNGIEEAKYYGKIHNIEVINGIEFSASFMEKEIHILGYFFDTKNKNLLQKLKLLEKTRFERNLKLTKKLNDLNLNIDFEYVKSFAKHNLITRAHFAKALVNKGYAKNIKEAFHKYLSFNKEGYVKRNLIDSKEAIKIIFEAGGICSLAHPFVYFSENEIQNNIKILKNMGISCIECYYSSHSKKQTNYLINISKKFDLGITCGSDFHGENRKNVSLGEIFLKNKLEYKILKDLKFKLGDDFNER